MKILNSPILSSTETNPSGNFNMAVGEAAASEASSAQENAPDDPRPWPEKNFDSFFESLDLNKDGRATQDEFETVLMTKFQLLPGNNRYKMLRRDLYALSFKDLATLQSHWGLPFANVNLGYWQRVSLQLIPGGCVYVENSDEVDGPLALANYMVALKKEISGATGADLSQGVSKDELQKYYNARKLRVRSVERDESGRVVTGKPYDVGSPNGPMVCK